MSSDPAPAAPPSHLRDLRLARLDRPPPSNFEEFWRDTLVELLRVSPTPEVQEELPPSGASRLRHARTAHFRSLHGTKVHAFFSPRAPDGDEARPLLVSSHGYGGMADPERVRRLSTFGFDVVSVDARGFGRSAEETTPSAHGYIMTGIESPQTSILRGAVCDFIQAGRAAMQWFGRPSLLAFQGFSFAGGISLMAAAVSRMGARAGIDIRPPDLLAVGAPTFGDQEVRARICQSGSGHELSLYLAAHPEQTGSVLSVLRYFDTVYFAPYVEGRVIFGVGLDDPVVPAVTVYPIKNALPQEPELFELPCSHTTRREEQEWIRWESSWIRALRSQ